MDNNVKLLVSIGGGDTDSTTNKIARYLENNGIAISNIDVPKIIDNHLPVPDSNNTFGFHLVIWGNNYKALRDMMRLFR